MPILSTSPTAAQWIPYPTPAGIPVTPSSANSRSCASVHRENSELTVGSQSTAATSNTSGGLSAASREEAIREDACSAETLTYSAPLCVRNTFIDYPVERTPSLDEFLKERQVPHSWPSSRVEDVDARDPRVDRVSEVAPRPTIPGSSPTSFRETSSDEDDSPLPGSYRAGADLDFQSASLAAGPLLGTDDMPTVGSAGHHARRCKPCAFVMKGCNSGIHCTFCHLCDPGEKKRRRKEKVQARKSVGNRLRQSFSNGIGHFGGSFFS